MNEQKMNTLLANLVITSRNIQSRHWYVKGTDFFEAHAKLNEYYNQVNDLIDEVAELMLMRSLKPATTFEEYLTLSDVKHDKVGFVTSDQAYQDTYNDFGKLLDCIMNIKIAVDEENDWLISAACDNWIRFIEKELWMLDQR